MGYAENDSLESPPPFERSDRGTTTQKIPMEMQDSLKYLIDRTGVLSRSGSSEGSEIEGVDGRRFEGNTAGTSFNFGADRVFGSNAGAWDNEAGRTLGSNSQEYFVPGMENYTSNRIFARNAGDSQDVDYRSNPRDVDYRHDRENKGDSEYTDNSKRNVAHIYERTDFMISQSSSGVDRSTNEDSMTLNRPKNSCWNCRGDHMIGDCPEPKDSRRIAANRKAFMNAKARCTRYVNGGRVKRYHEEQISRGRPGELSVDLREAMGLYSNEVPWHIYRMRLFGYPPGWLENAIDEASSGLRLYGDTITMPAGFSRREPKINPDSIIGYPGFNLPMPFGEVDRGKEFGYPQYSVQDSIENMLRKLNEQNLLIEGDGIVSQPSKEPEWNCLSGLDRPVLNDGAKHGIGRGRYVETTLPRHLQPQAQGRGPIFTGSISPIYQQRIDRECRPMRVKPIVVPEDMDERYLPSQAKRTRESRTPSPSILQDGGAFDEPIVACSSRNNRVVSPVIVNLPPVPESNRMSKANSDKETGGSATGSSNDFNFSPHPAKRRKHEEKNCDSDDDIMIISDKNFKTFESDEDSDCLVINDGDDDANLKVKKPKKQVLKKVPSPEVVQVNSLDSEDWNRIKRANQGRKLSAGSSTGDEDTFETANGPGKDTPSKPSVLDTFDEDWEVQSAASDQLVIDEDRCASSNIAYDADSEVLDADSNKTSTYPQSSNTMDKPMVPNPPFVPQNPVQ